MEQKGDKNKLEPEANKEKGKKGTIDKDRKTTLSSETSKKNEDVLKAEAPKNNTAPRQYRAAAIANWLTFIGIIITAILGLFTIMLYRKTVEANNTSLSALEEAKRANDISNNSFEETMKQFRAINTPYMGIKEIQIVPPVIGEKVRVKYTLYSLTQLPMKLESVKAGIKITNDSLLQHSYQEIAMNYKKADTAYIYITNEAPFYYTQAFDIVIDKVLYDWTMASKAYFFTAWECRYRDLITNEIRIYEVALKLTYNKNNRDTDMRMLHINNIIAH